MNSFKSTRSKVLAVKHTASLQLLCTVGGNQARSDARSEFKILEHSLRGGLEAGRAHSCSRRHSKTPNRKLAIEVRW